MVALVSAKGEEMSAAIPVMPAAAGRSYYPRLRPAVQHIEQLESLLAGLARFRIDVGEHQSRQRRRDAPPTFPFVELLFPVCMPSADPPGIVAPPVQIIFEQRLRLVIERDREQVQPREPFQRGERDVESGLKFYRLEIIFGHQIVPGFRVATSCRL